MPQALRFQEHEQARTVAPVEVPPQPGGGIWCDVLRVDLQRQDGQWREPLHHWLTQLHPLTAAALIRDEPDHLAAAQERYVHVRLQAVTTGGDASADRDAPNVTVDLVMGAGFALTVRGADLPSWQEVWAAYAVGHRQADSVDFAVYHALAAVVAGYARAAKRLTLEAEGIDQRLVRLAEHHILGEIVRVRRAAMALRDTLVPARDGLQMLAGGGGGEPVSRENRPYYTDLRREVVEAVATVEGARESMGEAVEAFTSVQSTQMNRVMQLFTVLAVIIAPPTLVASIYGMNFKIPEYHWPHGYAYALGLMAALMVVVYTYVRRRHWL